MIHSLNQSAIGISIVIPTTIKNPASLGFLFTDQAKNLFRFHAALSMKST